jgi:2-dehydropantoate 2-reductase
MNIAIVGPGAIGLLMAGYLQKSRAAVTLVDHIPARADMLNREGIRWEGTGEDFRYSVPVTVGLRNPGGTDLVIVCVKAYHTDIASRQLREAGYTGPVMTLQNGAGNAAIIGRNLPGSPLIAGITSEGANLAADNHVRHAGRGKTIFGAATAGRPGAAFLDELVAVMRSGGLDAELAGDPESLVWSKVLINAGINALTAILGVRNGRLLEIAPARELMSALVREGWDVIRKMGMSPAYDNPVARVEETCRNTAGNLSSMFADMQKGQRTEIDFINGAIVREGSALGLPCPCNEAVTRIIHSMELLKGIPGA